MPDNPSNVSESRNYRETLFLPKTDFPMRGKLPKAEPEWIKHWDDMNLYRKMRDDAASRQAKPWLLHDGPPYANGPIHIGTGMQKILKDIVIRSHQMAGWDASYLPGWDCHGLPIEWKVEEDYRSKGKSKDEVPSGEFRAACRAYAAKWIEVQKQGFRRLGVEGEWDAPYLTMDFVSESRIVAEFLRIAMTGNLVRGVKPIMWSPVERTALAEAEVEYADRDTPSIWVKFGVSQTSASKESVGNLSDVSVVIWTTTPWTIPANQLVAFGPNMNYSIYEVEEVCSEDEIGFVPYVQKGEKLIISESLVDSVMSAAKVKTYKKVCSVSSDLLQTLNLVHPLKETSRFFEHLIPLVAGDHVSDDTGSGFVHSAPAHGEEDYFVCLASGMSPKDIRDIVDENGCYNHPDLPDYLQGLDIVRTSGKKRGKAGKANDAVIRALVSSGMLLARNIVTIRDAHSWRSKAPVIRRATPQWFIPMDKPDELGRTLRQKALEAVDHTLFFPESGKKRLRSMIESRPDWLVSRQRNWGVPLTLFINQNGEPHTSALPSDQAQIINQTILEKISAGGVEAWFDTPIETFFENTYYSHEDWTRVTDVLDVWFDSGTTHAFAMREKGIIEEKAGQVDLYLEGSDQHRGWFQSSLLECCATRGMAPYRQVLTHGFIVDGKGQKMSKSIGNTVDPKEFANQYGIEILRVWTAASDFTEDLRISKEIIESNVEMYRKLRNTLRFLLGALNDFEESETVDINEMPYLERWVLHRLSELDELVRKSYEVYDFKKIMAALINFCGVDLSAVYFDIRKDSLYCDAPSDVRRRSVRTVMDHTLRYLLSWLAPILVFTTEEAFRNSRFLKEKDSVHLTLFPDVPEKWRDSQLARRWEKIFQVRRVVTGALEIERKEKRIGSSLEAAPKVYIRDKELIDAFDGEVAADIFISSQATLIQDSAPADAFSLPETPEVGVIPDRAVGIKCARSWKYFDPETAIKGYEDITPRDAIAVQEWEALTAND